MSRIANRPLTKPRDPHRFADLAQVIAAIGLLSIPAFLYASQRAALHDTRQRISELEDQLIAAAEHREVLRVQRAMEEDPRRVRDKAERLLGLEPPESAQVKYLPRTDPALTAGLVSALVPADGHP